MNPAFLSRFVLRFLSAACYGLLALLPAAETAAQQPEPPFTAQEILQRMANRYATCKSYRDTGVVTTADIDAKGKEVTERRFTTAFIRPDRFRFEDQIELPRYGLFRLIIWAHGDDVRSYWDATPPAQQHPSLQLAVAAATGVTEMTAYFIPALLMPKQVGLNTVVDNLDEAERLEDAKHGEHDCFCIGGQLSKSSMTLWIDKPTFLLRKIQRNTDFAKFRSETTITYAPVIDAELEAKELEFDPPLTRSVPSVPEMLGSAEPPETPGWLPAVGWVWLTGLVGIGAIVLLIIVFAVKWAAITREQRDK